MNSSVSRPPINVQCGGRGIALKIGEGHWIRLSNGMNFEPNFTQFGMIQNVATIKQERWFGHTSKNLFIIQLLEHIPLGQDTEGVSAVTRFVWVGRGCDGGIQVGGVVVIDATRVAHFMPHFLTSDFWVVDKDLGLFFHEISDDKHTGGLAHVTRVLLEGISHDCDFLTSDGIEHFRNHLFREALLLVIVHENDLIPVSGALIETICFAEVDQVEDILLEAGSSESDGRVKKAVSNTCIHTNSPGDFGNISSSGFTESGDGVDRRDTLGEECVGDELGEFGGPQVGGEDLRPWDPIGVYANERLGGLEALGSLVSSNQDTVGLEQIRHGSTFGKELWVAQDLKVETLGVGLQDAADGLSRADGDGRLFDNNLVGFGHISNGSSAEFTVFNVGSSARSDSLCLGWGVYGDENDIGALDFSGNVRGEE
jgi:hypothetical protein